MAVLLEHYRNQVDEPIIRQLALLKFELQEGLEAEFNGALDQLVEHDRNLKFDRLFAKLESTGKLEPHEMRLFQKLSMPESKKFDAKP